MNRYLYIRFLDGADVVIDLDDLTAGDWGHKVEFYDVVVAVSEKRALAVGRKYRLVIINGAGCLLLKPKTPTPTPKKRTEVRAWRRHHGPQCRPK